MFSFDTRARRFLLALGEARELTGEESFAQLEGRGGGGTRERRSGTERTAKADRRADGRSARNDGEDGFRAPPFCDRRGIDATPPWQASSVVGVQGQG